MSQETWIIASLSYDLHILGALKEKLVSEGKKCLLSTSNEENIAMQDEGVFYDENPINAFQKLLDSLDKSESYKLIIEAHGSILNGKHVLNLQDIKDISNHHHTFIRSDILLNMINASFKISETLLISCYGGLVHKDLNPSSNIVYTVSHPMTTVSTNVNAFRLEDNISTIKDLVTSIAYANIEENEDEDSIPEVSLEHLDDMDLPYDILGFNTIYVIFSKDGVSNVYYTGKVEEINEDALSKVLEIVPQGDRHDCFDQDFKEYLNTEEFPGYEHTDNLLFIQLRTLYSLLSNSTKEQNFELDAINSGIPVHIDKESDLFPLFLQNAAHFLNRFEENFDVEKNHCEVNLEFAKILDKEYMQMAIDFIPHQDGYQFAVLFFIVSKQDLGINFVSVSKQVGQSFKDDFFQKTHDITALLSKIGLDCEDLTEIDREIIAALESSRDIMQNINEHTHSIFSSIQEAADSFIDKLFSMGLGSSIEVVSDLDKDGIIKIEYLEPDCTLNLFAKSEKMEVDIGEMLFAKATGEIYDWVTDLTT